MTPQKRIQSLFPIDLIPAFAIAAIAHLLFFSLTTLQMPFLGQKKRTDIAFLGAILDSFEVEKLSSERTLATNVTLILKKPDQRAGLSVTTQTKPNFTKEVNLHPKNFFKSTPQTETPIPKLPSTAAGATHSAETEQQPYQRLRLYQ